MTRRINIHIILFLISLREITTTANEYLY